jgi:hypothetical protein
MGEKQRHDHVDAERRDEVSKKRQPYDNSRHDDRRRYDRPHSLSKRHTIPGHCVGRGYPEDEGRKGSEDGEEHRQRKARPETLLRENLGHPAEGEALRRKGERVACRKRGGDDDHERPDKKGYQEPQHDDGRLPHRHLRLLPVAIRLRRRFALKLMTIRMNAITLAETRSLAIVTR